jgi:hypothetical protein
MVHRLEGASAPRHARRVPHVSAPGPDRASCSLLGNSGSARPRAIYLKVGCRTNQKAPRRAGELTRRDFPSRRPMEHRNEHPNISAIVPRRRFERAKWDPGASCVHSRVPSPYRGNAIVARPRQSLMVLATRNFQVNVAALRSDHLLGRGVNRDQEPDTVLLLLVALQKPCL